MTIRRAMNLTSSPAASMRASGAPTVGELYSRFGAVGTYLRTGNPDLRPETSNGIDVGVKFVQLVGDYRSHLRDTIVDTTEPVGQCAKIEVDCVNLFSAPFKFRTKRKEFSLQRLQVCDELPALSAEHQPFLAVIRRR